MNFQVVSYNCSSTVAITGMETMAQIANGRLHCHNAEDPVSFKNTESYLQFEQKKIKKNNLNKFWN